MCYILEALVIGKKTKLLNFLTIYNSQAVRFTYFYFFVFVIIQIFGAIGNQIGV